jgi:hypothetical protein
MGRYYFDTSVGDDLITDDEGLELEGQDAARLTAFMPWATWRVTQRALRQVTQPWCRCATPRPPH